MSHVYGRVALSCMPCLESCVCAPGIWARLEVGHGIFNLWHAYQWAVTHQRHLLQASAHHASGPLRLCMCHRSHTHGVPWLHTTFSHASLLKRGCPLRISFAHVPFLSGRILYWSTACRVSLSQNKQRSRPHGTGWMPACRWASSSTTNTAQITTCTATIHTHKQQHRLIRKLNSKQTNTNNTSSKPNSYTQTN